MELPYDPGIPLLCVYPKKPRAPFRKAICTLMLVTPWWLPEGSGVGVAGVGMEREFKKYKLAVAK